MNEVLKIGILNENTGQDPASIAEDSAGIPQGSGLHPLLQILHDVFNLPAPDLAPFNEGLPLGPVGMRRLKEQLIAQKIVTHDVVQQALALLFEADFSPNLDDAEVVAEFTKLIPIRFAKKFCFFPIRMTQSEIWFAVEEPFNTDPLQDVERRFNRRSRIVVSTHQAILSLINRAYERTQASTDQVIEDFDEVDDSVGGYDWGIEEPEDLIDARDEEPIKRLLNNILYRAARDNASDVHIDANPSDVTIRFRVDGVLHTATTLPKGIQRSLVNRVKIMSRLDIAQHSLPQDGHTLILIAGRRIDIRVSTMPTVHGEKAVMRLLYQDQNLFDLRNLGLPNDIYASVRTMVGQSGGIILVSGPTGSGKTTTLYAALNEIDRYQRNIMTIEDPVEYKLSGYVQTEVNPKVGLTFANALRSVLRQDPDVIMVGEMRDKETALIAIQAALTGHLVFSTVHTNDAPSTITRLVDMGIEPYLVTSTVIGVIAQRLVRRICSNCIESQEAEPLFLKELGLKEKGVEDLTEIFSGRGCPECNGTGFRGRSGVFELLMVDDAIRKVLRGSSDADVIRKAALKNGMKSMRRYGIGLIGEGVTTVEEVLQFTRQE